MNEEEKKKLRKQQQHEYYLANKEEWCARTNRNRRLRKANDPEYREKCRVERRERQREIKIKFRKIILESKSGGCIFCDEKHPAALDLHHKDPSDKTHKISDWYRFTSEKKLRDEIEKCEVVCANCHRKLHAEEKGYYGYL